jgi:hypothetical protein
MHVLEAGDRLRISAPRNRFPVPDARTLSPIRAGRTALMTHKNADGRLEPGKTISVGRQ